MFWPQFADLLPFLEFRHLVRSLYGFELDQQKMAPRDRDFPSVSAETFARIRSFLDWMKAAAET